MHYADLMMFSSSHGKFSYNIHLAKVLLRICNACQSYDFIKFEILLYKNEFKKFKNTNFKIFIHVLFILKLHIKVKQKIYLFIINILYLYIKYILIYIIILFFKKKIKLKILILNFM